MHVGTSNSDAIVGRAGSRQPASGFRETVRRWWQEPTLNGWVVGAIAVLVFLRKPHALLTPQLYAEDGTIFLTFNDLQGVRAMLEPYMGYLHTLPRLIAWTASKLLDPAWWPAFYNGASFAIWVAVIARTFSSRFRLPGKPWLALAFLLGPQTGEVLINITNLQWIIAFVLVQHVLLTRPETPGQRLTDLMVLLLVGLTGPFAIAFTPLFGWRWWRERNGDSLGALLVVGSAAAVQAWFILRTGEKFPHQAEPFHVWATIEVVARRMVVWPAAGSTIAWWLPRLAVAVIGATVIGAAMVRTLRPDPHREPRLRIAGALVLIAAVSVYRMRPDTWGGDDLNFSDRYFYIPRVLFAWLLILEFNARPRALAWAARLICLSIAAVHLKDYVIPAPIDYQWKKHCDPIRRGEPGDIPTLPEGWILEYRGRPKR
ncbi:MAG: hypothetical protein Q7S40_01705 [Opitutaceae bacterium]|nr:hypothetical protein [Opitutaceae bacterium]